MPLGKNVQKNIKELYADNRKKGKEKGAKGKARPRKQIIAIAMHAAGKSMMRPKVTKKMQKKMMNY